MRDGEDVRRHLRSRPGYKERRGGHYLRGRDERRLARAWLDAAGLEKGALFRGVDRRGNVSGERMADRTVAWSVQRAAEDAGLESDVAGTRCAPVRHDGGGEGKEPRRDHASDRPPKRQGRARVHPSRHPVHRHRRHGPG